MGRCPFVPEAPTGSPRLCPARNSRERQHRILGSSQPPDCIDAIEPAPRPLSRGRQHAFPGTSPHILPRPSRSSYRPDRACERRFLLGNPPPKNIRASADHRRPRLPPARRPCGPSTRAPTARSKRQLPSAAQRDLPPRRDEQHRPVRTAAWDISCGWAGQQTEQALMRPRYQFQTHVGGISAKSFVNGYVPPPGPVRLGIFIGGGWQAHGHGEEGDKAGREAKGGGVEGCCWDGGQSWLMPERGSPAVGTRAVVETAASWLVEANLLPAASGPACSAVSLSSPSSSSLLACPESSRISSWRVSPRHPDNAATS